MDAKTNSNLSAIPSVFLVREGEGIWSACISSEAPVGSALLLCAEKNYPASVYYRRYDLNGSAVYEQDICENQDALLSSLNWCGKNGHTVLEVWDFDFYKTQSNEIINLFNEAYSHKMKLISQELESELSSDGEDLPHQAMALLDNVLKKENGEELMQLAGIMYSLQDVASEEVIIALAPKILEASVTSALPLLTAERVDAVRYLLEFGMNENHSPDFPEATAEQMADILMSCDLNVFTEIVESVALDNQVHYAPDNVYSIEAEASREAAVAFMEKALHPKPSLDDRIKDASRRTGSPGSTSKEHGIEDIF